ncbi:MAG: transcriptional regulator [Bacillus thermozeamaize]|uniref:Transcriptional regulator n=1 Tax=Bacillus thermozeamaize TaxID=230954 RepID=A0A1Y3PBX8_9BACI|nr:MAG: transcriptional regulator [Bacillus thermozeamaize]
MAKSDTKEWRQEQVIEATSRCIVEKGLADMSMKDIAREANVSTGIIYHYFKNKEDLLLQVIKRAFQKSHEQVMETVETLSSPVEKLERHLENILAVPKENPDFFVVLLNYLGEAKHHPELQAIVAKFFRNLRFYVEQYLQEGVEQGLFAPEQVRHLPALLYSVGLGLGVMWMMDPESVDANGAGKLFLQWMLEHLGVGRTEPDA